MAISASLPAVTTVATLLAQNTAKNDSDGDFKARRYLLKNVTGSAPVFLGPSGVTTATGFQWDVADGALALDLEPGESLYGIVSAVNQTVHVLASGR